MLKQWYFSNKGVLIGLFLILSSLIICNPSQSLRYSNDTNLSKVNVSIIGNDAMFGFSISGVGDVNGDGFDDFIVSEKGFRDQDNGIQVGKTNLIFGKEFNWNKNMSIPESSISFIGEDDGSQYTTSGPYSGWGVEGAGDVNGDGFDDILIAAPFYDNGNLKDVGKIYLVFGRDIGWEKKMYLSSSNASFIGEASYNDAGSGICGLGDINGDGFDDFLIASDLNSENGNHAGQNYLIFGKRTGWSRNIGLSSVDASFLGEHGEDGAFAGWGKGKGDINNDGYNDILIGSGGNDDGGSEAGKTYVIFGKPNGWMMDTSLKQADLSIIGKPNDGSGGICSIIGDINGDGYDDFTISTHRYSTNSTNKTDAVSIFFGKASYWNKTINISMADASFLAESPNDDFGNTVNLGDINKDNYDDFAIGASFKSTNGYEDGEVYIIPGKSSGWKKDVNITAADASFIGEAPNHQIGFSIAGNVDINNDGYNEILISTHWYSTSDTLREGKVYIIFEKQPLTNNPPVLDPADDRNATAGTEIEIEVKGHDPDAWDSVNLTYSLESAPEGMTINSTKGNISWIPTKAQIGGHRIVIRLTDGKESTNTTLIITVTKPRKNNHTSLIDNWPIFIVLILIVTIILVVLYFRLNRRPHYHSDSPTSDDNKYGVNSTRIKESHLKTKK